LVRPANDRAAPVRADARARAGAGLALLLALFARNPSARGSGFYLQDRGVRPLSRGGAFVAGADDASAIWYNPAGLSEAGNGFFFDASLVLFGSSYARAVQPPGTSAPITLREVQGSAAPLPIPTIAVTHNFGLRHWTFAAGLYAPYAALTSYPNPDDPSSPYGATPPQRYSLIDLNGSLLLIGGVWAAWSPDPRFSVGAGVQVLAGTFDARLAMSACPATVTCAPEDPQWDAQALMSVGPIIAPSGNAGVRWTPSRYVTFGASGQLPFWIDAPATLAVRLPPHAFFDGAMVHGDRANVAFTMAPILRAGVEVRPTPNDRIEAAFVAELWSVHDAIVMTPARDAGQPDGIQITNVRGVGTYQVGPVTLPRGFRDAFSVRLGYERRQVLGAWTLSPRLGLAYETSATPPAYTSVLTLDSEKLTLAVGAGLARGNVRVDLLYAHAFTPTLTVSTAEARLYAVQPFRESQQAPTYAINAGTYRTSIDLLGAGVRIGF
jgi:long-chain fatty acid transport protein